MFKIPHASLTTPRILGCVFVVAALALVIKIADVNGIQWIRTSNQLLAELESGEVRSTIPATLSSDQAKKAAAALRKKYPIVSIRERLHFQSPMPDTVEFKDEPVSLFEQILLGRPRTSALIRLHQDEVTGFINTPGAGYGRMQPLASPYDL